MAGKAASSVPASMMDGLSQLLPDIAVCMAAPDADIPFLDKLQKVVLLRIHQPVPQKPTSPGQSTPPPGGTPGGPPAGLQGQGLPGGPPGAGAANGQMRSQGAYIGKRGPKLCSGKILYALLLHIFNLL